MSGTVARRHVLNEAETPVGPGTLIAHYVAALERIRDLPPGAWDKTMRKIARDALEASGLPGRAAAGGARAEGMNDA